MSKEKALSLARQEGLDLVLVTRNSHPPVAKILDWGKYSYQQEKKQRQQRNNRGNELKQMRFGLKIGEHDLEVKLRKVNKFLEAGHKVKLTVFIRGREMEHKDLAFKLADELMARLENAVVEQTPSLTGRQLNIIVRSKNAQAKKS